MTVKLRNFLVLTWLFIYRSLASYKMFLTYQTPFWGSVMLTQRTSNLYINLVHWTFLRIVAYSVLKEGR